VIAEITSVVLVVALVFAKISGSRSELFMLGAVTFLLAYLILLIKDLDDPFDCDENGKRGAVEVSLQPLEYLAERMATEAHELAAKFTIPQPDMATEGLRPDAGAGE
jgi:hypothetical protein